ncbi:hypothetical protein [Rhizobium giardinii]|uniref:Uncharacterized protein n=1 Tax=Rhizobium giardinii TaxID=56731 RepID=A0A7W8XCD0_9HYPH|nr:hypothetical protein [Rhizobium giardinii]MBB5539642.1 hypothetical protein [Rhizobium giardinii]
MSQNPFRSKRLQQTNRETAHDGGPTDDVIIEHAYTLFGSEAATAVALCGLDAWFDGEEEQFRRLAGIFRRLKN